MASSDFGRTLSVGAIRFEDRFCASKKGGIGGGGWVHPGVPCTWQLPWLAREEPWSAVAGPFFTLLAQRAQEPLLSPCRGIISESVGSFQSAGALAGRKALTIESSLMSGCG